MTISEMLDWIGYDRYKGALEDQAVERVKMEQEAEREARRQAPRMRKR